MKSTYRPLLLYTHHATHKNKSTQVSIPNVAVRWVLDQPAVGGAIVGVRFGLQGKGHVDDNSAVFKFALDEQDKEDIAAVTRRSQDLLKRIGDCGDEYRRA
jgi:aryl-alcohol dehydrogenase-like predicted oxidoreductase